MHVGFIPACIFLCHDLFMFKYFNLNPSGRRVGDCSVRAVAKALNISWETAYSLISAKGFKMHDMPSSDAVWGAVLKDHGFKRSAIPNTCPDCYTADDFCRDNPHGTFVMGFGGHVATAVDGILYDVWDSSQEIPLYVWKG